MSNGQETYDNFSGFVVRRAEIPSAFPTLSKHRAVHSIVHHSENHPALKKRPITIIRHRHYAEHGGQKRRWRFSWSDCPPSRLTSPCSAPVSLAAVLGSGDRFFVLFPNARKNAGRLEGSSAFFCALVSSKCGPSMDMIGETFHQSKRMAPHALTVTGLEQGKQRHEGAIRRFAAWSGLTFDRLTKRLIWRPIFVWTPDSRDGCYFLSLISQKGRWC